MYDKEYSQRFLKEKNVEIIKGFKDKDSKYEISKIIDDYGLSLRTSEQIVTDFYNPVFISDVTENFQKHFGIYDLFAFGGFEYAERRCFVFNKTDDEFDKDRLGKDLFDIEVLKISTNLKFNKPLEHRAILGSILGLGITRSVIGDIILEESQCFVFVKKDIADYILYNLEYVGRSKVKIERSQYKSKNSEKKPELKTCTVVSMRCDVIVASITKYSRSEVKKLFDRDLVFINWKVCNNTSDTINVGDIITIRKFGRVTIEEVRGVSKKGKLILDYSTS